MRITNELLKILSCPVSKSKLIYDEDNNRLISLEAELAYPVENGVPIMLPDQAKKLTPEDLKKFKK